MKKSILKSWRKGKSCKYWRKAKSWKPEEKPNPSEPVKKKKPKDLNFTNDDETFSEPFIGHLKVFNTSTFNLKINEYVEKEEEEELNKIVANIKKLKFLDDDKKEEKEYERKFLV